MSTYEEIQALYATTKEHTKQIELHSASNSKQTDSSSSNSLC